MEENGARAWFVYLLFDIRDPLSVRYVGITKNTAKRLRQHKHPRASDKSYRAKWVRAVLRDGGDIVIKIVGVCQSSREAEMLERGTIAAMRSHGARLVNGTDGGGGLLNPTDAVRKKISTSVRKSRTPEFRARLSKLMKDKATPERREKLSLACKAAHSRPDVMATDRLSERMKPRLSSNTGQYKGVSYYKTLGKWAGRIHIDRVQKHLGLFPTPEEAAHAYDKAAFAAWGRGCYLNFPADLAA